jgi:pimeloyl-ACP methyl ester carboxylesterase
MRIKLFVVTMLFSMLLASCGRADDTPTPTEGVLEPTATVQMTTEPPPSEKPSAEPVATFEEASCPFELPAGQVEGETVECGYLVVPEDRANPDSPTIRLAVATFRHPDGAAHPDPIIYLSGGPGGSGLELLYLSFDKAFAPLFAANRDIIVLDQRGVGLSEPALDCPALTELVLELLDGEVEGKQLTDDEEGELFLETVLACEEDLSAIANLAAYNTAANAADVNGLRLALGYDQVNLWGASYGTRLALGVMRDYPAGLRSVVLDSVYPPDVDMYLELPANVERAFSTLFDGCAADAACSATFPDLRTVFFDTVDRLNDSPAAYEITNALTRERYDALLDGNGLVGILFQYLYLTEVLPSLPQIIYDANQGNFNMIALIQGSLMAQQEAMSFGMQLSVQCNEEFAFNSLEEYEAVLTEYPELVGFLEDSIIGKPGFQVCADWDSGQADPIENEPVLSDVPTLLMGGEFDPITPPAWGRHAAETLENGYFFEYPAVGHGASAVAGCPREMMIAFLNDPTRAPDDACIAEMRMKFVVPTEEEHVVEFEPFTSENMGISGVAPVGWTEAGPGVFSRASSGLDVATLIQQAAPGNAEGLLALLTRQLGLEETPESVGEREANDLSWTLYTTTVQGLHIDVALAESEGLALIVLLQSTADEHDALYESVFLPVLDALIPAE